MGKNGRVTDQFTTITKKTWTLKPPKPPQIQGKTITLAKFQQYLIDSDYYVNGILDYDKEVEDNTGELEHQCGVVIKIIKKRDPANKFLTHLHFHYKLKKRLRIGQDHHEEVTSAHFKDAPNGSQATELNGYTWDRPASMSCHALLAALREHLIPAREQAQVSNASTSTSAPSNRAHARTDAAQHPRNVSLRSAEDEDEDAPDILEADAGSPPESSDPLHGWKDLKKALEEWLSKYRIS